MLRRLHIQPQSSRTCTATPESFVSCSRLPANEYVLGPRMNMFQPHNRKGPTMIVSICSCGGFACWFWCVVVTATSTDLSITENEETAGTPPFLPVHFAAFVLIPVTYYTVIFMVGRWFKLFVTHSASPPKKCPPSFPAKKAALIFWVRRHSISKKPRPIGLE